MMPFDMAFSDLAKNEVRVIHALDPYEPLLPCTSDDDERRRRPGRGALAAPVRGAQAEGRSLMARPEKVRLEVKQAVGVGRAEHVFRFRDKYVQVHGTFVAAVQVDATIDGSDYFPVGVALSTPGVVPVPETVELVRVRATAYVSGEPKARMTVQMLASMSSRKASASSRALRAFFLSRVGFEDNRIGRDAAPSVRHRLIEQYSGPRVVLVVRHDVREERARVDALGAFTGGRLVVVTAAPVYKCPAAPYEAVMLLEHYCRKRKIRERTQIDLYAAEPGPMGVAGPEVSKAVRKMVEEKGIACHPEHQVTEVDAAVRRLRFANGAEASYDLLAYAPPHRAPRVVRASGLVGDSGWISVDRHTMQTTHERVFALGDVVSIPLKLGKPLPKAGVFAHAEAEVVAKNIARAITDKGRPAAFDGEGECFIETGDGKAGFGKENFYAEPVPEVKIHPPGRHWHAGKVLFEKDWLRRWF